MNTDEPNPVIRFGGALLTSAELAAFLKITPRHLANLRDMRLIPFIRLGRAIRYDRTAVVAALDESLTVKPKSAKTAA